MLNYLRVSKVPSSAVPFTPKRSVAIKKIELTLSRSKSLSTLSSFNIKETKLVPLDIIKLFITIITPSEARKMSVAIIS